jgi:hypothetical protein
MPPPTLLFSVPAPSDPPSTRTTGIPGSSLKCSSASSRSEARLSYACLTGLPVSIIFSFGKYFSIPSYATQILSAFFARSLFVTPA